MAAEAPGSATQETPESDGGGAGEGAQEALRPPRKQSPSPGEAWPRRWGRGQRREGPGPPPRALCGLEGPGRGQRGGGGRSCRTGAQALTCAPSVWDTAGGGVGKKSGGLDPASHPDWAGLGV